MMCVLMYNCIPTGLVVAVISVVRDKSTCNIYITTFFTKHFFWTSSSRSHSPSRLMSPRRISAHNGEKDWENGSTISSPASIPEYTGQ